jgi:hypothetical protein
VPEGHFLKNGDSLVALLLLFSFWLLRASIRRYWGSPLWANPPRRYSVIWKCHF